jgi:hypothetical protein
MKNDHEAELRRQLVAVLKGGEAHAKFDDVVGDIPVKLRGTKPAALPHSAWMLLEHMRLAQWDILEFSRNPKHVSPKWPEGYWPSPGGPPNAAAWEESIKSFHKDLKAMQNVVTNSKTDLYARIPWGDGQTILREVLLLADHNAYHLAQIVDVRRALGSWPE